MRPRDRKTVNKDICKYLQKKFLIFAPNKSIICNRCRHVYRKERSKTARIQQRMQLSHTDSDYDFQHQETLQTSKKISNKDYSTIHSFTNFINSKEPCILFHLYKTWPKLVGVLSKSRLSVFVEKIYRLQKETDVAQIILKVESLLQKSFKI